MVKQYEFLQLLAARVTDELIITNVGGVAREWYHLKDRDGNLYRVQMGGSAGLAFGLAVALPERRVICLDGDGSVLMGLTVLPAIGERNPGNLIIIVFDNESYLSPGNIPTFTAGATDLVTIAQGAGIRKTRLVKELTEFEKAIDEALGSKEASFIVVKVEASYTPVPYSALDGAGNKYRFIQYVEKTEHIKIIKPAAKKI